jgi:hypothetical protein
MRTRLERPHLIPGKGTGASRMGTHNVCDAHASVRLHNKTFVHHALGHASTHR